MNNEIEVKKDGRYYEVAFVDGDIIKCKCEVVRKVAKMISDTTPEEIAPLVVRVKSKSIKFDAERPLSTMKVSTEAIGEGLAKLLAAYDYDYDRVREIIEELTVQEIEDVFNSHDPVEALENL